MEINPPTPTSLLESALQWGHGVEPVEIDKAGMLEGAFWQGFNGATGLNPWRSPKSSQTLRTLGRCFNGATGLNPWRFATW